MAVHSISQQCGQLSVNFAAVPAALLATAAAATLVLERVTPPGTTAAADRAREGPVNLVALTLVG